MKIKKLLIGLLLLCMPLSVYAQNETRTLHIEIQGDGQAIVENKTISCSLAQSFDMPYNEPVTMKIIENQDTFQTMYVNEQEVKPESMQYTFDMKENYNVRIVMQNQGSIKVNKITYYKYKIDKVGTWTCGLYTLSNGAESFCAEANNAPIADNQTLDAPEEINNPMIRKILYYGYNGPKDMLTAKYGKNASICMTSEMLSKAYSGITAGEVVKNKGWEKYFSSIYEEIKQKEDPYMNGYTAYICKNHLKGYNFQNVYNKRQDVVYGKMEEPRYAHVQIKKTSKQPSMTENNSLYSFKGARYGIYTREDDARNETNPVVVLVTDEQGFSQTADIQPGQYFIKEIQAPKGYKKNETIFPKEFLEKQTYLLTGGIFSDMPETPTLEIIGQKLDSKTDMPIAKALFKIEYYPPNQKNPAKTWMVQSDQQGYIKFPEELVNVGTLTLQEKTPAPGYVLNAEKITIDLSKTYKIPVFYNDPVELTLKKIQKGTQIGISEAEFLHTCPDQTTETIKTDANGMFTFEKLMPGTHTLQETHVKDGYEINPEQFEFTVNKDGTISIPELIIEDEVSPYTLEVYKKNTTGIALDGAQFTLYEDRTCQKPIETLETKTGKAAFKNLIPQKTYYLKETKAPENYKLKSHIYEIKIESIPEQNVFTLFLDGKETQQDALNRVAKIEVINYSNKALPNLGSNTTLLFAGIGFGIIALSIWKGRKKDE